MIWRWLLIDIAGMETIGSSKKKKFLINFEQKIKMGKNRNLKALRLLKELGKFQNQI